MSHSYSDCSRSSSYSSSTTDSDKRSFVDFDLNHSDRPPVVPESSSPLGAISRSSSSSGYYSATDKIACSSPIEFGALSSNHTPLSSPPMMHQQHDDAQAEVASIRPPQIEVSGGEPDEDIFSRRLRQLLDAFSEEAPHICTQMTTFDLVKTPLTRSQSLPTVSASKGSVTAIDYPQQIGAKRRLAFTSFDEAPSAKRIKPDDGVDFAAFKPASLRRAESLKAPNVDICVPTVPASPIRKPHAGKDETRKLRRRIQHDTQDQILGPVPVIAPPLDYVPQMPLSPIAMARLRLRRLIERETVSRAHDGLDFSTLGATDATIPRTAKAWDKRLGVARSMRKTIIGWIQEVVPVYTPSRLHQHETPATSPGSSSSSSSSDCSDDSPCTFTRSDTSSSTSSISYATPVKRTPDLLDQLTSTASPETRFHAAHMFLRYCFTIVGHAGDGGAKLTQQLSTILEEGVEEPQQVQSSEDASLFERGQEIMLWDVGVACLALSVKYHRDVLKPLSPVFSYEFEGMSPHKVAPRDLEFGHRSVLAALSYTLGVSPGCYLDELWTALPSLRGLLDFPRGWDWTRKEAWCLLTEAVIESDALRFPLYLLTGAALAEAITPVLRTQYEYEAYWHVGVFRKRSKNYDSYLERIESERLQTNEAAVEVVVQDIQAALGVASAEFDSCRRWLSSLK